MVSAAASGVERVRFGHHADGAGRIIQLAVLGPTDCGVAIPAAVSAIWRILNRRSFVTPQPHKRPRSSGRTFTADQPNERLQADTTHWQLRNSVGRLTAEVEILNIVDDHSRLDIGSDAYRTTTAGDVVRSFRKAFRRHGSRLGAHRQRRHLHRDTTPRGPRRPGDRALGLLGVRLSHSRGAHP